MNNYMEALREANGLDQAAINEAETIIAKHKAAIEKRTMQALSIKVNEFGQEILTSDYGDDDLNFIEGCVEPSVAERTDRDVRLNTQIMALLTVDEPAYTAYEHTSTTKLRDADFYDDGMAFWIGDQGVVAVSVEKVPEFEHHLSVNGMTDYGAHTYTIEQFDGLPVTDTWTVLNTTCKVLP